MKLMSAGDVTQLLQMQSIEQVTHHTRLRYTLGRYLRKQILGK